MDSCVCKGLVPDGGLRKIAVPYGQPTLVTGALDHLKWHELFSSLCILHKCMQRPGGVLWRMCVCKCMCMCSVQVLVHVRVYMHVQVHVRVHVQVPVHVPVPQHCGHP